MRKLLFIIVLFIGGNVFSQSPAELKTRAKAGDATAMMELAEQYRFGFGLEKNEDSASYWVKKAVETGDPDALYLRGVELTSMVFSVKFFREGVDLLELAGEKGHPESLYKLSEIYRKNGTDTQTDNFYSKTKAFTYAEQAAKGGLYEAMLYCGECLLQGEGCKPNDSLAISYLERAAEGQMPGAQIWLGQLWLDGDRTGGRDLEKSLSYFRDANRNALSNLEQKTDATVGIHEVDMVIKRTQNLMIQATGLAPQGLFTYPLSE